MFCDACSGYDVVLASTPIKIATNVRHASKGSIIHRLLQTIINFMCVGIMMLVRLK